MWTIFLIMAIILALSWGAYYYWEHKLQQEEKQLRQSGKKIKSERLQDAEKSFEEYVKKMGQFKKPGSPPK